MAALRIESAARVGVVHRELLKHLRHGDVIAVEPRRIEQHLILHHRAAEAGIIRDAGDLFVGALDHPVFESFQFLRGAVGTFNHVAVHQAEGLESGARDGVTPVGR